MIKMQYVIIDCCEYGRSDTKTRVFKDEDEINKFIDDLHSQMYDLQIYKKEVIKDEKRN